LSDQEYMKMALELAKKGCGWVAPNPMVGAVIVKDGRVIGQGWHQRYGEPHAERNALASCVESPQGATMYVTLEPCCHHGKQPPCVDAILEAQIARVVAGSPDPNPLVGGKGIRILKEHGIEVTENVLRQECDQLNEVFFHYIRTKQPYVVMKYAMTMDGKIAAYTGASKWVTGENAREHVQTLRHRYTAIMVGVGTILADDPLLTCRISGGKNPIRIICDTGLRTPLTAQVIKTIEQAPVLIATCCMDEKRGHCMKRGMPHFADQGEGWACGSAGTYGKIGGRKHRQHSAGGGRNPELGSGGKRHHTEGAGLYRTEAVRGSDCKDSGRGNRLSYSGRGDLLKNSHITQLGEDFLIEGEVDMRVYRDC